MILVVTGGRDYQDDDLIATRLSIYPHENVTLYHGACPSGADKHARVWAKRNRPWEIVPFRAAWGTYGRMAGPMRNQRMIKAAAEATPETRVVLEVFLGGNGTANCVECARRESWIEIVGA